MKERIIVTGAAGKLGRVVLAEAPADVEVIAVDRTLPKDWDGTFRLCDVRHLESVREALEGATAVIHLAAIPGPREAIEVDIFEINVQGTYHISMAARDQGIKRLVYASSVCWFGYPFSREFHCPPRLPIREDSPTVADEVYCLSKRLGEECMAAWARQTDGTAVSLRYPWIVNSTTIQLMPMDSTNLAQQRGFFGWLSDTDCARATWQACGYTATMTPGSHEPYILAGDIQNSECTTRELLDTVYPDAVSDYGDRLDREPYASLYDTSAARRAFGFAPAPAPWRE